jgi:hypothetical protein
MFALTVGACLSLIDTAFEPFYVQLPRFLA